MTIESSSGMAVSLCIVKAQPLWAWSVKKRKKILITMALKKLHLW